jgi:hypothetical protein
MATTTNYGWTTPDATALVKDGAAAIRTLGSSVDTTTKNLNPSTTLGDIEYRSSTANVNTRLPLGTAGQVLKVNSGATAPEWSSDNAGMTNPMTTTGDTIYSSSGSTPARLAIGSTGNVLTVAGGVPSWAAPASAFPATTESANVSAVEFTTSTSYTDLTTASAVTLTTGTKALVIVSSFVRCNENGQQAFVSYQVSGATSIAASDTFALSQSDYDTNYIGASRASLVTLTAGSNTFTMKFRATGGTARCQTYNRQIFVMNLA